MLTADELRVALEVAAKEAATCCRMCRVGGEVNDGHYGLHHNGLGSRDTDYQIIHATTVLAMSSEALTTRLKAWIVACHMAEKYDLNG